MNRRTFVMSLVASAGGILILDWGQRIFPMYPRGGSSIVGCGDYFFVDCCDSPMDINLSKMKEQGWNLWMTSGAKGIRCGPEHQRLSLETGGGATFVSNKKLMKLQKEILDRHGRR